MLETKRRKYSKLLQHYNRAKAVICNKGVKWADSNSNNTVMTFKNIINGNENIVTLHTSDQLLFVQKATGKQNLNGLKIRYFIFYNGLQWSSRT